MNISPCRLQVLQETLEAWNETGFPFLRLKDGVAYPLENNYGGDPELFYFIPWVCRTFNITLESATWWWDTGTVSLGVAVAVTGFWHLAHTKLEKLIAATAVVGVGIVCWSVGDVYVPPFFAFCFAPWVFVFLQKDAYKSLFAYSFIVGFVIALTHSIRMYGGVPLALAGISAIILYSRKIKTIIPVGALMLAGMFAYSCWFSSVIQSRNNYLDEQHIPYGHYELKHVFWHSTYIGLGFLNNEESIYYGDCCALKKAREIKPTVNYCSSEYETILRDETFRLCKEKPQFIMRTLFAKGGVLLYYLLVFANVGLICAWYYRKPWYLEFPYFLALGFSALPGILTIPIAPYLTGFFTVATFYGIHSIIWALQHGLYARLRALRFNPF